MSEAETAQLEEQQEDTALEQTDPVAEDQQLDPPAPPADDETNAAGEPQAGLDAVQPADDHSDAAPSDAISPELEKILQLTVPIIVRLSTRSFAVADVMDFSPGTILEFDKQVDEPLDLMINNKCIGRGIAVKVGENFGLRVTYIGPLADTIRAMGG